MNSSGSSVIRSVYIGIRSASHSRMAARRSSLSSRTRMHFATASQIPCMDYPESFTYGEAAETDQFSDRPNGCRGYG